MLDLDLLKRAQRVVVDGEDVKDVMKQPSGSLRLSPLVESKQPDRDAHDEIARDAVAMLSPAADLSKYRQNRPREHTADL